MKRSILSALVAAAFLAFAGSASAHVITSIVPTCTGATVNWTSFPGGPFDVNLAFQDQANGKAVASPFVVAHLSGKSGSQFIAAPAAAGVTFRSVLGTWTVDGGGSKPGSAWVKCATPPPGTTTTTPGTTVTTPGQTVTVTKTVTTPGSTVTVTTPAVTVTTPAITTTVAGPTITVAGPVSTVAGPTTTTIITKPGKPTVKRITKIVYRRLPVTVKCPPGFVGSDVFPIGKGNVLMPGKPILAVCKKVPHSVKDIGVTG